MANQIIDSGLFPVNIGSGLTYSNNTLSTLGGGGGATPSLADVLAVSSSVANSTTVAKTTSGNAQIKFVGSQAVSLIGGATGSDFKLIVSNNGIQILNETTTGGLPLAINTDNRVIIGDLSNPDSTAGIQIDPLSGSIDMLMGTFSVNSNVGLSATFSTADGTIATFTNGILTGLV